VIEYGILEEEISGFLVEGMSTSKYISSDVKLIWGSIIMSSRRRSRRVSLLLGLLSSLLCSGPRLVLIGGVMMLVFRVVRARIVRGLLLLMGITLARELETFTRKRNARDS
jgi:hypothetical protein